MGQAAKMLRTDHSETALRLRDTLARCAQARDVVPTDSNAAATGFEGLVQHIVRAIDGCVLPRRFALESVNGVEGQLVIANRRLVEIKVGYNIVDVANYADETADSAASCYVQAIRKISQRATGISLRLIGRAASGGAKHVSCSAPLLERVAAAKTNEGKLPVFFQSIKSHIKACILEPGQGASIRRAGSETDLSRLDVLSAALTEQSGQEMHTPRLKDPSPTCFAIAMPHGLTAIVASEGASRLTAAIPRSQAERVIKTWQSLYSTRQL